MTPTEIEALGDERRVLEAWKPVREAPHYEVSDMGRVRNTATGAMLNPASPKCNRTYSAVSLHTPSGRLRRHVHRLVGEAFVVKPDGATLVRHIDGNNADNRARNLAWGTPADNMADRERHGRTPRGPTHGKSGKPGPTGADNHQAKLDDDKVRQIRALAGQMKQRDIAAQFGVHQAAVWRVIHGRIWCHVD
jgi:hypothetical protein